MREGDDDEVESTMKRAIKIISPIREYQIT